MLCSKLPFIDTIKVKSAVYGTMPSQSFLGILSQFSLNLINAAMYEMHVNPLPQIYNYSSYNFGNINNISSVFYLHILLNYVLHIKNVKSVHCHLLGELICSTVKGHRARPPRPLLLYQIQQGASLPNITLLYNGPLLLVFNDVNVPFTFWETLG